MRYLPALAVILWPLAATANVITFGTAPTVAATRSCAGAGYLAPLDLLDEGGLRVQLNNPIGWQNRYPCDPTTPIAVEGFGSASGWRPLDLTDGLRAMTIWYQDAGYVSVESLTGGILLGLTVTIADRGPGVDACAARVTTNRGQFPLCTGRDQVVWFADYGLTDVVRFSIAFLNGGYDPTLQLLAVQVPDPQTERFDAVVPEPSLLMLWALAGLGVARRRSGVRHPIEGGSVSQPRAVPSQLW